MANTNDIKKIDVNMADNEKLKDEIKYYDGFCDIFTIHGLYWAQENHNYHRLPDVLETRENLKALASNPSGGFISFETNSTSISVKVKNSSAAYMAHMSPCGQLGLDLYTLDNDNWVFLGTTKINKAEFEVAIIKGMDKNLRKYRIYLPLYITLIDLQIGFDSDAIVNTSEPIRKNKIIWYGTSISQGGCATRSGMTSTSILERKLKDYEVYNFGFSGNAHLDIEVSEALAKIDNVKYIIIESESNNTYQRTKEKLYDFLKVLKDKNPLSYMFVLSHYPNPKEIVMEDFHKAQLKQKSLHKRIVKKLNDKKVIYIDGEKIIKDEIYDVTVDSIHQTDLGFLYVAKYIEKLIKKYK